MRVLTEKEALEISGGWYKLAKYVIKKSKKAYKKIKKYIKEKPVKSSTAGGAAAGAGHELSKD